MTIVTTIDLNADIGEGCGNDAALMPFISSANICCGAHAGDLDTTAETIALAKAYGIAVGAHPGYQDPANFGRVELNLSVNAVMAQITQQLKLFTQLCQREQIALAHIKCHGALYHRSNHDNQLANALCGYLSEHFPAVILYAQSATPLVAIAQQHQLKIKQEGFIDRRYHSVDKLVDRQQPDACITDHQQQLNQFDQLVNGEIQTSTGGLSSITVDTFCLHGDNAAAVESAKRLWSHCQTRKIVVRSDC